LLFLRGWRWKLGGFIARLRLRLGLFMADNKAEPEARLSDSSLRILETMEKHDNTRITEDE